MGQPSLSAGWLLLNFNLGSTLAVHGIDGDIRPTSREMGAWRNSAETQQSGHAQGLDVSQMARRMVNPSLNSLHASSNMTSIMKRLVWYKLQQASFKNRNLKAIK